MSTTYMIVIVSLAVLAIVICCRMLSILVGLSGVIALVILVLLLLDHTLGVVQIQASLNQWWNMGISNIGPELKKLDKTVDQPSITQDHLLEDRLNRLSSIIGLGDSTSAEDARQFVVLNDPKAPVHERATAVMGLARHGCLLVHGMPVQSDRVVDVLEGKGP